MAATRLIALHINKGKTVAQCLADRMDYSENPAKTENGKYVTSYECSKETCDEEFLLSKRQYEHITGRHQKHDVIAYQIRQSFKPGEITPEEANKVGYELAIRFTKGKHAFDEYKTKHGKNAHLPKVAALNAEYAEILERKKANYREYRKAKAKAQDWLIAQRIVQTILNEEQQKGREKEQIRQQVIHDSEER